jgi:hypothetical protein
MVVLYAGLAFEEIRCNINIVLLYKHCLYRFEGQRGFVMWM